MKHEDETDSNASDLTRTPEGCVKAIEQAVKDGTRDAFYVTHATKEDGTPDLDKTSDDKRVLKGVAVTEQEVNAVLLIPEGILRMAKVAVRDTKGTQSRCLRFALPNGIELLVLPPDMAWKDKQQAVARRGFEEAVANATPPRSPRAKVSKEGGTDSQA